MRATFFRASLLGLLLSTASAQDGLFSGALRASGQIPQVTYAQRVQVTAQWTSLNGPVPGLNGAPDRLKVTGVTASTTHTLCINPIRAYHADLSVGPYSYTLSEYGVIERRGATCALILPTQHLGDVTLTRAGDLLHIQASAAAWFFNPTTRLLSARLATATAAAAPAAPTGSARSAHFAARIDRGLRVIPSQDANRDDDTRRITGRTCRAGTREISARDWDQGPDLYALAISGAIAKGTTDFEVLSSDWAREQPSGAIAFSRLLWYMTLLDKPTGDHLFIRILSTGDTVALDTCRLD